MGIQDVVSEVKDLLDDIRAERSNFVLEDAYRKLGSSSAERGAIMHAISRLPQPITQQEKYELARLNKEYKRLLANFLSTIEQLNLYLKQKNG